MEWTFFPAHRELAFCVLHHVNHSEQGWSLGRRMMPQTIIIGAKDPNIAYLLQRYAEESGFQAAPICQNDDLLDTAIHLQPIVIILDIDFIETADWEMVRRLKAEPATHHLPIVVYSCLNEPPDNWREGVDGFLLQSASYDDFVAVLKHASSEPSTDDAPLNMEQANWREAVTTDDPIKYPSHPADRQ